MCERIFARQAVMAAFDVSERGVATSCIIYVKIFEIKFEMHQHDYKCDCKCRDLVNGGIAYGNVIP